MASLKLPQVQTVSASDLYVRLLLYGDTGTGKTSLAVTANLHPQMAPVMVLNFDDGLTSVAHIPGIRYVTVQDTDEALAVMGQFLLPPEKRMEGYGDVKTLIVDSLSAWRDAALQQAVNYNSEREAAKQKPREMLIPQIQDYGQMTYSLSSILHGLTQLPLHLILTAGVDEELTDGGTLLSARPLVNPKLRQMVGHMMSFIWYTKVRESDYRLLTLPRGVYQIKTRNPRFVEAIKAETRRRAGADKADIAEGWWAMGLDDEGYVTPGIADLYSLYLSATAAS